MNQTKRIRFRAALCGDGWIDQPVFEIDTRGIIVAVDQRIEFDEEHDLVALPGMVNLHSHAFQRGFAGLSEYRTSDRDSFWTWRSLMYDFVEKLTPLDCHIIATQLYLEMLATGYTWVGEFHYLHLLQSDSTRYQEMLDSIRLAATKTGIGICYLPVLYQRGGFGDAQLTGGQKRFQLSNEQMLQLVEQLRSNLASDNERVGLALHSLRAVAPENGNAMILALRELGTESFPIHIHVAEQEREVEDCVSFHGCRSVEFLFDNYPVDENWCLIHATHLNDRELQQICESNAVVGLCPTTEANLGDGIFRSAEFLDAGGRFGIGSDSHSSVNLMEELRLIEYGQRLQTRNRAILGDQSKSVGRQLYENAAKYGGQAIGGLTGVLSVGSRADMTLVDPSSASIGGAFGDRLLDRLIFCTADHAIAGVAIGGKFTMTRSVEFQQSLAESTQKFIELNQRLFKF